ncbi:MAG: hypothetical protein HY465_01985 [Deltaproteobacteria bacterium]|nr:hypothetical protein [Deltaproteobacteria bacterium]
MKNFLVAVITLISISTGLSCGSSTATTSDTTPSVGYTLTTEADFTASASASLSALTKQLQETCPASTVPLTNDDPSYANALDCDNDLGIVAHVTPSQYAIAFRRISLIPSDDTSEQIDFLADTGSLASSEVITFTSGDTTETVETLGTDDLQAGTYSGIEAVLYYFQLTFPVAGTTRNVRIYMSDDNFESEGSLGHHQGDITFIDDTGTELGWVDDTWLLENISTTRGEAQNGAGGIDAQTMHERGFFGNEDFWNAADQVQGASADNFLMSLEFDEPLTIPEPSAVTDLTTITATFSTADTFYYEDFAPQNTEAFPGFYPADGGEATSEGAEWAPLAPTATITVSNF